MDIGKMMRQVQDMQTKMNQMQEHLGEIEMQGISGGGMVVATLTGKGEMKKIVLDPKVVNADDKEVLEDLIVAAINDGKNKIDAAMAAETEKMMGGLKLPPGVKLPF